MDVEPEADSREPGKIAGLSLGATPPDELPSMGDPDSLYADLWSTGISPFAHPVEFMREKLRDERVVPAAELKALRSGSLVRVAGIITHRQRPSTANGTLFVSLEDETGMVNVIVARKTYEAQREAMRGSRGLLVTGLLERADGALNVLAGRVRGIEIPGAPPAGTSAEGGNISNSAAPRFEVFDTSRRSRSHGRQTVECHARP